MMKASASFRQHRKTNPKHRKQRRRRRRRWFLSRLCLFAFGVLAVLFFRFALRQVFTAFPETGMESARAERSYPAFPASSDVVTVAKETEREWVENHLERFGGLRRERLSTNDGLIHFLYRYGNGDFETGQKVSVTEQELQNGIPLFLQWDARWGYDAYGENVIGLSGCGPTCVAMVAAGLSGNTEIHPRVVADYAMEHDYYLYGTGTKWSFMLEGPAAFGISGSAVGTTKAVIENECRNGSVLILNVGSGHFTSTGHFIVVCGLKDGKLIINDPNSPDNSRKLWDYKDIADEIRAGWSFR